MPHDTARTLVLHMQSAPPSGGVDYARWLIGTAVPLWLTAKVAATTCRFWWHRGTRARRP